MNMRITALYGAWLLCAPQHAFPSETSTNGASGPTAEAKQIDAWMAGQPDPRWRLYDWIKYQSAKNGRENFVRYFGPLTAYNWAQAGIGKTHRAGQDRVESKGEDWFANTIGDTMVDSFASWFNFSRLKRDNPAVNFGVKFAEGTLDSREGRLQPDSLEPDDVSINESWTDSFLNPDKTKYGANLLNENPYLFFARAFGKQRGGLPLFITDTRIRLMFLSSRIGSVRIDQGVTVPFNRHAQVTAGYQFYPVETMGKDSSPSLTIRLTYLIERNGPDENVFYCSTRLGEHEQLLLVGFSCDAPIKTLRRFFR